MNGAFRLDNPTLQRTARPRINLDGDWAFMVDPRSEPEVPTEEFYSPDKEFTGTIKIPGCWQAQTGRQAATSFLHNYRGISFYKTYFTIPTDWQDRRTWLRLGGVSPAADVWVNDTHLGFTNSSRTPLKCEITDAIAYDTENVLVIKVSRPHKRLDGTWDYPNGGWEGIYRSVEIESSDQIWVDDVFVRPDVSKALVQVQAWLGSGQVRDGDCLLQYEILSPSGQVCSSEEQYVTFDATDRVQTNVDLPLEPEHLWSPRTPVLYTASIVLRRNDRVLDTVRVRFGMREPRVEGNRLFLNNVPLFLSGFGWNIGYYPRTICPPADKVFYVRRLELAKAYGFNYTKTEIEAVCPEMLEAADEVGMLVTFEMPFGMNGRHRLYRYDPPAEFVELWERELQHHVRWSRNYACVFNYSMTSELSLERQSQASFDLFNRKLPQTARGLAPHTLVTDTTSGAGIKLKTPLGTRETDICEHHYWRDVADPPDMTRGYRFGEQVSHRPGEREKSLEIEDSDRPFVFHEYLWWSAYPNVALKPKYKDHPMRPYWLTEAERVAKRRGLDSLLPTFVQNSETALAICRKEGIEFARLQPAASGFVLYMLLDMTWSVEGLLDDLGDPKDVAPADLLRSTADTVILFNDHHRRCYRYGKEIDLDLWISHYGAQPIKQGRLAWQIAVGDQAVLRGERVVRCPCGSVASGCRESIALPEQAAAAQFTLSAKLVDEATGQVVNVNRWLLWGFPAAKRVDLGGQKVRIDRPLPGWKVTYPAMDVLPADQSIRDELDLLVVTQAFTEPMIQYLAAGGRAIVFSKGAFPEVQLKYCDLYRTIPWNTGTSGNSGTVIAPHRALAGFPHDSHCDLQFVHLIKGAFPLDLDAWRPARIDPIVRSIGHYRRGRSKAYLFEAAVGKGRLLVTSFNVRNTYDDSHPETVFLVDELLGYALSDAFLPQARIDPETLRSTLADLN